MTNSSGELGLQKQSAFGHPDLKMNQNKSGYIKRQQADYTQSRRGLKTSQAARQNLNSSKRKDRYSSNPDLKASEEENSVAVTYGQGSFFVRNSPSKIFVGLDDLPQRNSTALIRPDSQ